MNYRVQLKAVGNWATSIRTRISGRTGSGRWCWCLEQEEEEVGVEKEEQSDEGGGSSHSSSCRRRMNR